MNALLIFLLAMQSGSARTCSSQELFAALQVANKEFVNDPNVVQSGTIWLDTVYHQDLRTPADRLRGQALELERKSDAAQLIKRTLENCAALQKAKNQ